MKIKSLKTLLITAALLFGIVFSVKIITSKSSDLRAEFSKNAKGRTLQFINSFIN